MDNYTDERDYKLLSKDKYTFSVLSAILHTPCNLIISDHKQVIICHTTAPYPVWIWTADNSKNVHMEKVWEELVNHNMLSEGKSFNIKYEFAEFLIERINRQGQKAKIKTNMFAYDCLNPIYPSNQTDGKLVKCKVKDTEKLTSMLKAFHEELQLDITDDAGYCNEAKQEIESQSMYFWKNDQDNQVACCKYSRNNELAIISKVFTYADSRRKHYAENMVYQVTKFAKNEGAVPMLYTDADYVASNACYEKIGYILRGKLCCVEIT